MNAKLHWPDVAVVVGCLFLYALVAIVDDVGNEKALQAEKERADAYQKVMVTCLNHGAFAFKDTQRAFYCEAKEI